MDKQEILKEMSMTYEELVDYLWEKYGHAEYDYFCTPECRSKSKKISRTNEGLFCHHIDEDKGACLSNPDFAKRQLWEYQKAERLVYCNYIEHLLLHIQITKMIMDEEDKYGLFQNDLSYLIGLIQPGVWWICEDINELYNSKGSETKWRDNCFKQISDNQEEYIMIIDSLIDLVRTNYSGYKRKKRIEVGAVLVNSKTKQKWNVISIDEKDKDVILTLSLGDQKKEVKKKRENFLGFNEALAELKDQLLEVISEW